MKRIVIVCLLCLSTFPATTRANEKGNGGNAVVCEASTQVLDVYEAEALRGFKLDLGAATLSVEEKVKVALRRLKKVDPFRAALLEILGRNFYQDTKFIRGTKLREVDDSDEIFLPTGCTREQLAIQNTRVVFSDPFYTVNEDLWDRLDNDNKAALILHEIIYRASNSAWHSPTVRFLNSMAFTNFLVDKTKLEYYNYVHGTPLKDTLNAGEARAGIWFFQMPDIRPTLDHFWDAEEWDVSTAEKSWDYMCRMKFSGHPLQQSDLPAIYSEIIKGQYDWGNMHSPSPSRVLMAMEHGRPTLFSLSYDGKIQPVDHSEQKKGEIWCAGNRFPFDTGFLP